MIGREEWAESCPACYAALATATVSSDHGQFRLCARCARLVSYITILMGFEAKVRPALKVVE